MNKINKITKKFLVFECYYKYGQPSIYSIDDIEYHFSSKQKYAHIFEEELELLQYIDQILETGQNIIQRQEGTGVIGIYDTESRMLYSNQYYIDDIDGVNIRNLFGLINLKGIYSRIINTLYKSKVTISLKELKEGVRHKGSDIQFENLLSKGYSIDSEYGKIWIYENESIWMNPNIRNHIDENNLI